MSLLTSQIQETMARIGHLEAAKKHYDVLINSIAEKEEELAAQKIQLDKELEDIEALESMNVSSIFDSLMGNKDKNLEKERQDYLRVSLKIKELEKNIELTKYEASVLESKAAELEQNKTKLLLLKKQRQEELLTNREEKSEVLIEILNEVDLLKSRLIEIKEAVESGKVALIHLDGVSQELQNAISWGSKDMYTSGSWSDRQKFDSIRKAADLSYAANNALRLFDKELNDIGITAPSGQLPIHEFSSFSREWIDNFISDWVTQNKVKTLAAIVGNQRNFVINLLEQIGKESEDTLKTIQEKEIIKDRWLID
ncbi:MAG: hypothetical protein IPH94_06165 [Saprospiraceae bacterium]|nr:hypothetical protein [Saprospiraceae bacterium]MBK7789737.1 hypothetical protein [Saprospiraceae bacterium]MBK8850983.1 hypothetical protein [Saprospiraceae bacterium]MBK9689387.1 hypothetical protein [Saprospiraceae bacterium]